MVHSASVGAAAGTFSVFLHLFSVELSQRDLWGLFSSNCSNWLDMKKRPGGANHLWSHWAFTSNKGNIIFFLPCPRVSVADLLTVWISYLLRYAQQVGTNKRCQSDMIIPLQPTDGYSINISVQPETVPLGFFVVSWTPEKTCQLALQQTDDKRCVERDGRMRILDRNLVSFPVAALWPDLWLLLIRSCSGSKKGTWMKNWTTENCRWTRLTRLVVCLLFLWLLWFFFQGFFKFSRLDLYVQLDFRFLEKPWITNPTWMNENLHRLFTISIRIQYDHEPVRSCHVWFLFACELCITKRPLSQNHNRVHSSCFCLTILWQDEWGQ